MESSHNAQAPLDLNLQPTEAQAPFADSTPVDNAAENQETVSEKSDVEDQDETQPTPEAY